MSRDLFLVPVTYPEFERTVISQIDLSGLPIHQSTLSELERPERVRVWGVKNSQLNKTFYGKMRENDYLLFYHKDKYRYFGKVGNKFQSGKVSEQYWGGIDADMLYAIDCFKIIDIHRKTLNDICGYKSTYQPQSIRRTSNKAYRRLKREYGTIEQLVMESNEEIEP